MNTTPTDEAIMKTDVLGRVKTPAARREQLLDEFERSGLRGQKFAALAECQEALRQTRRENELLRQKIDVLVRRVFGSSSERLDRAQLELLLETAGEFDQPGAG
jgi:hypothetical protein